MICSLIVLLIIHVLNILIECIARKHVFQYRRAIQGCFFQLIVEKNDKLKLCNNSE